MVGKALAYVKTSLAFYLLNYVMVMRSSPEMTLSDHSFASRLWSAARLPSDSPSMPQ